MGQGEGYKFSFENMTDFFNGMVYSSIPDIENVYCPLGKGGKQQSDYEFVIASKFNKIYANDKFVEDSEFLLLIVKKLVGEHHVGRRTLKYNPKMTYNNVEINSDCYSKIARKLGYKEDSAWFINEINIVNQDELHFSVYLLSGEPKIYDSTENRKQAYLSVLPKDKISNKSFTYTYANLPQHPFNTTTIIESILSTGLIYSPTLIKRLAFSLMAKPFVILSGLSGSGKTQLALAFAKCLSENIEEQVRTVSIGADWTNREPLLGYPNALKSGEYVMPESGVLQLLMRANEDPSKSYFLILDEMNLSVVERYFADFLSAMESGEKIKLWDNEKGIVPKEIALPKNVFIIGTINVDETTYMFSPKVLDRANVIEFKIAADEMDEYLVKKVNVNLESAYSACADMAVDFVNKANSQVEKDDKQKDVLLSFFNELKKVNTEFGYRIVNEICRYLHFADGEMENDEAVDTAILQKLLPKLHGSRKKLVPVLTSMWKLCLKDSKDIAIDDDIVKDNFKYPGSAEKIQRMYKVVVDNGFTSFAEA